MRIILAIAVLACLAVFARADEPPTACVIDGLIEQAKRECKARGGILTGFAIRELQTDNPKALVICEPSLEPNV